MADDCSFIVVLIADAIVLIIVPFLFQRLDLAPCDRTAWRLGWRDLVRDRKETQAFSDRL